MDQVAEQMATDAISEETSVSLAKERRRLSAKEIAYMRGAVEPRSSSVLTSTSKYLNNPYYRDAFAQFALRKVGNDLPTTYLIPTMVHALAEVRDDDEFYRLMQAERIRTPDFAAWLDRRRLTSYAPDDLREYATGTLGATILEFIETSGMDMEFMKAGLKPANDMEYVIRRRASHHDIEHMVTGYGPNILGETALAIMNNVATLSYVAPALGQYLNEANTWVSTAALYRISLHTPALMPHMYEAYALGIAAGQGICKPLFMIDWEDYLDWPIEDIAPALGFRRGPGSAWAFSDDWLMAS